MSRESEKSTTIRAPLRQAQRALSDDVIAVLGGVERPGQPPREFEAPLTVDLGRGTSIHQVVRMRAGRVRMDEDGVVRLPLTWEVVGRHLFPSFDGDIEVHDGDDHRTLVLAGHYHVPLGLLGRLGDAAAGRRVAQQSLEHLVEDLGRRLDAAVEARSASADPRSRPDEIDLRDAPVHSDEAEETVDEEHDQGHIGPELYIG